MSSIKKTKAKKRVSFKKNINLRSVVISLLFAIVGVQALVASHAAPSTHAYLANNCTLSAILVPSCGVLWGVYVPSYGLTTLESSVGRQFDIFQEYHDFSTTNNGAIPSSGDQTLINGGRILLASWTVRTYSTNTYEPWQTVASGADDNSVIIPQAQRIKALGSTKIFLSFDPEMEGHNKIDYGFPPGTPHTTAQNGAEYVAAYQHIYNVFKAQGVTNVVWVWTPAGSSSNWPDLQYYYPGSAYVDWIGYDPYNFWACGDSASQWKTPYQTFSPLYNWLMAGNLPGSASKPFILDEYGSANDSCAPSADSATNWYTEVPAALQQLPNLKAVSEFDSTGISPTLVNSGADLAGFAEAGLSPIITGQSSSNPPSATITSPADSTVVEGKSITVDSTASATSPATVTKVELLVNGNVETTDTTAPYNFTWDSLTSGIADGTISVTTEAFDSTGQTGSSSATSLKLDNGDVNGDGTVNISDLSILSSHWGDSGATLSQGDLNGDGVVNISDLSILASNWGDSD